MTQYFGFAFSASMLPPGDVVLQKCDLSADEVRELLAAGGVEFCLNPSHLATVEAARSRYGLAIEVPDRPPRVDLASGDSVVVMQVAGLPRLTDRHEYTREEIDSASFRFVEIEIL
jgi:hypothetical protein